MSEIKVTQVDRDAVDRWLNGPDLIDRAFARHRIEACASVQEERDALREMLDSVVIDIRELVSTRSDHFTMRNGERRSIEGDDGEKCWLVHSDPMFALESFLARYEASK